MSDVCLVNGCNINRRSSNGYCAKHYYRWKKHGDPEISLYRREKQPYEIIDEYSAAIPLTRGYKAIVDLEDAPRISESIWQANVLYNGSYVRAMKILERKAVYMHHEVLMLDSSTEIDHEDRNGLNNKKSNLRVSTHQDNMLNTDRHDNRIGVSYNARANLWMAYLDMPYSKRKYLGYRKTKEEALELVEQARCQ